MKALVSLLLLVVVALCYSLYRKEAAIKEQQKTISILNAQVSEGKHARSIFELQERCAEQARKSFNDMGYNKKDMAGFENHYNEKLNKCFVEITNTQTVARGEVMTTRMIFDALEGKNYGEYFWQTEKGKKYWEVAPFVCDVIAPSGEKQFCKSDEEFKELMKPYMDIS